MILLRPDRGLCLHSSDGRFGIRLQDREVAHLLAQCEKTPNQETGGVLIGCYSRDLSMALVTEVTPAPVDSRFGPTWFDRGIQGLAWKLHQLWKRSGTFYLGEWHFHPGASPSPSVVDSSQMATIARSGRYACPEPLLLIVGGSTRQWNAAAYVYDKGQTMHTLSPCGIESRKETTDGESSDSTPHRR